MYCMSKKEHISIAGDAGDGQVQYKLNNGCSNNSVRNCLMLLSLLGSLKRFNYFCIRIQRLYIICIDHSKQIGLFCIKQTIEANHCYYNVEIKNVLLSAFCHI